MARAQGYIQAGHAWVVNLDLAQFFDRVNHDRAFLTAGVLENELGGATEEATPQGGPLSPLLSNLMLDDLDRELGQAIAEGIVLLTHDDQIRQYDFAPIRYI
ncbi:reverse transcriptase domain-containing protein [Paraburkholderia sp. SIMBA_054]|uniref:reverse transcriptase domain-containing protein n=1 Tax=Paraburkholderia sp. SIMBA_054 TaxID=3085795 RepID=UPI00397A243F